MGSLWRDSLKISHSFTAKLILIITAFFLITVITFFTVAQTQFRKIIDKSQKALYEEKLQILINDLDRSYEKLEKTGLAEAYSEDFKQTALHSIKDTYYGVGNLAVKPFILDNEYSLKLHWDSSAENRDWVAGLKNTLWKNGVENFSEPRKGSFFLKNEKNEEVWYIFRTFPPWEWCLIYSIPAVEKYQDLQLFRNVLLFIVTTLSITVLFFLFVLIMNFTSPIVKLTGIARKIANGDLEHRINIKSKDEIGILAQSFDEMQRSVKQKLEDLKGEIAERKQAEKNLSQARQDIASLVDTLPSIIIGVDREMKVTQWNKKAAEFMSLDFENVRGRYLIDVYPELQELKERIEITLQEGSDFTENGRLIKAEEGKNRYEDVSVYPLIYKNEESGSDEVNGAVIRIDDVTEKNRLEFMLYHARKMESIGQLAGGVAHDFNNMLAGIFSAAQLLQRAPDMDEQNLRYIGIILEASERAGELTRKLLDFGRKTDIQKSVLDFSQVLSSTRALLERTIDKKIKISVMEQAVNTVIEGDASSLQNAIINLAVNASHAMPEGGTLSFLTRNVAFDSRYCELSPFPINPGDFIELEVSDTGTGIPDFMMEKIFDPFFTTKKAGKGTGLGLTSVYTTVKNHNGDIRVYSEVGRGTSFHIHLPCSKKTVTSFEDRNREHTGSGTILLIDDEAFIRQTSQPLLESMGYKVLTAENGAQGIEIYTEKKKIIDLVITDMIMPEMNGHEVFYQLQKVDRNVKVILSSGFSRSEDLRELQQHGLKGFIQKPFDRNTLGFLLHEVLSAELTDTHA